MTETLTKILVNCSLPEGHPEKQTVVPLTAEEIAQREADALAYAEQKAIQEDEEAAKTAAKASATSKLKALGLSDSEIAALAK